MSCPARTDLVLVEGYGKICFLKNELHRKALDKPHLHRADDSIIAISCDAELPDNTEFPVLDINDIKAIARFI